MEHYQVASESETYDYYPIWASTIKGNFNRLKVDDDAIVLNHSGHADNLSQSHLVLKGDLSAGHAYIRCKNGQGTDLIRIDHSGKLHCLSGLDSAEITQLQQDVTQLTTYDAEQSTSIFNLIQEEVTIKTRLDTIESEITGTHEATDDTLVRRDNTAGTQFTKLTANVVEIVDDGVNAGALAMYGDAAFHYIPQDAGVNVSGAKIRIGKDDSIGGGNVAEGIELIGREVNPGESRNEIRLYTDHGAPGIDLVCNKAGGVPYISCEDEHGVVQCEISPDGVSTRMVHVQPGFNVTPGQEVPQIEHIYKKGKSYIVFNLDQAWNNESDYITMTIDNYGTADDDTDRFLTWSVYLDESEKTAGFTDSVVYIDQISRNVRGGAAGTRVRIILGMELIGSETEIAADSKIVLQLNAQKTL